MSGVRRCRGAKVVGVRKRTTVLKQLLLLSGLGRFFTDSAGVMKSVYWLTLAMVVMSDWVCIKHGGLHPHRTNTGYSRGLETCKQSMLTEHWSVSTTSARTNVASACRSLCYLLFFTAACGFRNWAVQGATAVKLRLVAYSVIMGNLVPDICPLWLEPSFLYVLIYIYCLYLDI